MPEIQGLPEGLERRPELLTEGYISADQAEALSDGSLAVVALDGGRFEVGTAHVTHEEADITSELSRVDFDDSWYLLGLWVSYSELAQPGDPDKPIGRAAMMTLTPRRRVGWLPVGGRRKQKDFAVTVTSLPR